jgi:hypothetical protein
MLPTSLLIISLLISLTIGFQINNERISRPLYLLQFTGYLDNLYSKSSKIKCPFFRRRTGDVVDAMATTWNFFIARHKSLDIPFYELPGCSPVDNHHKLKFAALEDIAELIIRDWNKGKGYYINGILTKEIYTNDCLFDGPDPDMPVKGLRKYLSSASQLFDRKKSKAELIELHIDSSKKEILVRWRLEGILNLPWHPHVKPWTGSTRYILDDSNLICAHVEKWDISVFDAFLSTLFPALRYGSPPAPPLESEFIYERKSIAECNENTEFLYHISEV